MVEALKTAEPFKLESMSGIQPVTRWVTPVSMDASKSSRIMLETSVDRVLRAPNCKRKEETWSMELMEIDEVLAETSLCSTIKKLAIMLLMGLFKVPVMESQQSTNTE